MPIYMKVDGIAGPVTRDRFEGWIELESCQLGTGRKANHAAGRDMNREASRPPLSEIVITKQQDRASTSLFRLSFWGEGKKVTIVFVNHDGNSYLELELYGTLVSNFSVSGHGGIFRKGPLESFSLDFTNVIYRTNDPPKEPEHAIHTMRWQLAFAGPA